MNNSKALKYAVFESLKDKLTLVANDQYKARCELCGDSSTNISKKRFYVKFNFEDDSIPIEYNCFNCGESGALTPKVLREFNVYNLNLNSGLISLNKTYDKKKGKKKLTDKLDYKVPLYDDSKGIYRDKLKCFNNRMGLKLDYKDLQHLKAVFDFSSFIKYNEIDKVNINKNDAIVIEKDYLGFLTTMNDCIMYRNIRDNKNPKHFKYKIEKDVESFKFYTIPSQIDILSKREININISEGVYDILGVYYHINKCNNVNHIYAAVTGASYNSVLEYFFDKGVFGSNVIVNIYSDDDKKINWYKKLINRNKLWYGNINIYYNRLNKDCGTTKKNIDLFKAYSSK